MPLFIAPFIPPILPWDSIHPQIIHFPIVLLLTAPLFVALGIVVRKRGTCFAIAALCLMGLGAAGTFVAVESGEAAAQLATRTPEITEAIGRHQEMAETTRLVFTLLTVLYAAILFGPALLKRPLSPRASIIVQIVFFVVYAGCLILVADTGHLGGLLVHKFGVRAMMP
ncbi:MAG: hypothetical protein NTW86_04785 [Candidatus Sumerlaeota bacterium]|nr:hypothetical protein [Candidatus Sumerlaeota bacterium]